MPHIHYVCNAVGVLDDGDESQDIMMQECLVPQEAEPRLAARRDSQLLEQLRHTQEKLQLKEREVKHAHCSKLRLIHKSDARRPPHRKYPSWVFHKVTYLGIYNLR